jgi:hypothetical protein
MTDQHARQQLSAAIDALRQASFAQLSDSAMCESVAELRQQIDQLEALFTERVAVVHERGAALAEGFVTTGSFLRHTCRLSSGSARRRVDVGLQLQGRPAVAAVFAQGAISYPHASLIMKTLTAMPDALAADAEPVMIEAARMLDTTRLAEVARRLRHIVDPDGQGGIDERHHEQQWLEISRTFDDMFVLNGLLDAESGAALKTALEAVMGPPAADDMRTAAQRRAEALTEIVHHALDSGELPETGGDRPHLLVVAEIGALRREAGAPPAELQYAGPIGTESARRIACDASVTRIVVADRWSSVQPFDPSVLSAPVPRQQLRGKVPKLLIDALPPQLRWPSQPLDVGRSSRLATAAIRRALLVRDRGCVMPGCDCPPGRLEAHHIVHWIDGGPTSLANMVLLCPRHHRFVHEKGWSITRWPDGSVDCKPPLALTG